MMLGLGPRHFHGRKLLAISRNQRHYAGRPGPTLVRCSICLVIAVYVFGMVRWYHAASTSPLLESHISEPPHQFPIRKICPFRKYPPHRYYQQNHHPLPSFLTKTEYIFGEFPAMLPTSTKPTTASPQKLCVDQSGWYNVGTETSLPFADGTNPSILRLRYNPQLELQHVGWDDDAYYLATICMTNSQCAWKDSPEEIQDYRISTQSEPSTVHTVLLVLNQAMEVLEETRIETLIDANFGRKIKASKDQKLPYQRLLFALDDARLFTYQNELWVSYREGPNFGYDKQVLNKVHIDRSKGGILSATLMASEVETLCCGRNMALLDDVTTQQLRALTWIDPITVVDVQLRRNPQRRRRLTFNHPDPSQWRWNTTQLYRRQLGETKRKSDFHGTNGFMVHLPVTNEYLGIGHFHRPPGREANKYARFGHHYTHAFFTIPDKAPFYLKRLSPELVLPSFAYPDDAEIIQFWSGLERVNDETLVLAYGINDCEGAATYIDMDVVQGLLRDVAQGKEVIDFLEPPKLQQSGSK